MSRECYEETAPVEFQLNGACGWRFSGSVVRRMNEICKLSPVSTGMDDSLRDVYYLAV